MHAQPRDLSDADLQEIVLAGARSVGLQDDFIVAEPAVRYVAVPQRRQHCLDRLLSAAAELTRRRELLRLRGQVIESPDGLRQYLCSHFANRDAECFVVVFLNAQQRVVALEEMFVGTLTQTAVYPREVVRRSLEHNVASVVLAHNHPSGQAEPSRADEYLTQAIKAALALVEIKLLDHVIVAGESTVSFIQHGLL